MGILLLIFTILIFAAVVSRFLAYIILFSIIAVIYMKKLNCGFKAAFEYCIYHGIFQRWVL